MLRRRFLKSVGLGGLGLVLNQTIASQLHAKSAVKPNILWIIAEDVSPHLSCYGEETIETPHIDRLAADGAKFTRAFVTNPVCSPSRSAMITGMYATSIGAHNHRGCRDYGKGRGEPQYWESYQLPDPVTMLTGYFHEHGYFTVNGGPKMEEEAPEMTISKTDYNFIWDMAEYDSTDWSGREPGQPFFAQYQLDGGKAREVELPDPVDPARVELPPQYPDHPALREDWARYLNAVKHMDNQVGEVLARLEAEGILENTVVFFLTDHGMNHARAKQYLYDEGIRIPLIVRWPEQIVPGSVRDDFALQIDLAPTSLHLAGLPVPDHMHGRALFSEDYSPRDFIVATRHRCDETVDNMRCVRTKRYKYIRNYHPEKSHMQPNQYKDGLEFTKILERLHVAGELTPVQNRLFQPNRPTEELYDLQEDPHELTNLVGEPGYQDILHDLRRKHLEWMTQVKDLGLIPEPELERLGRKYGSKYAILRQPENDDLIGKIREVLLLGERGQGMQDRLLRYLRDPSPSIRYWSAWKLGNLNTLEPSTVSALRAVLDDPNGGVRTAAARALALRGDTEEGLPVLITNMEHPNHVVRHYSALAIEELGNAAKVALTVMRQARNDEYEYVKRVARRFVNTMK